MDHNKDIYIIADLHLNISHTETAEVFKKFLESISSENNCLYILGDFFDYWIGDDHTDEFYHQITEYLKQTHDEGLEIFFMHGNRDFLIGKRFTQQSNVKLIKDPYYLNIADKKIVLAHGDRMCGDDKSYLFYRSLARNRILQFIFLRLPLFFRQRLAKTARGHSYSKNTQKPNIDVTTKVIDKYRKDCDIVIHGHTHKMAIHLADEYTRYVLGDWFKNGNCIKISKDGDITQVTSIN